MYSSNRYYGIRKGSKKLAYQEVVVDPNLITADQAILEYDFLSGRRSKILRAMAREVKDNRSIKLTDSLLKGRQQIQQIDDRMAVLLEMFPEVA